MTNLLIIVGIIAFIVVIYILSGFTLVQQSSTIVVERLGRYNRTLPSGINFILPILEKPRTIETTVVKKMPNGVDRVFFTRTIRIDLREQLFDFPDQDVISKENIMLKINAMIYYQITDPFKSVYEINNLPLAIEKLTLTTLRSVIGEMNLDEILSTREAINTKIRNVLDDTTNKWGVKVNRVELLDITPPATVKDAMEKEMKAERDKRAQILEAEASKQSEVLRSEGEKVARINKAEAEKQTKILEAQGKAEAKVVQAQAEADAIRRIADAIKDGKMDPAHYMLADQYIASLKEISAGKDSKLVYLPYEASTMLSSIGALKDIFQK